MRPSPARLARQTRSLLPATARRPPRPAGFAPTIGSSPADSVYPTWLWLQPSAQPLRNLPDVAEPGPGGRWRALHCRAALVAQSTSRSGASTAEQSQLVTTTKPGSVSRPISCSAPRLRSGSSRKRPRRPAWRSSSHVRPRGGRRSWQRRPSVLLSAAAHEAARRQRRTRRPRSQPSVVDGCQQDEVGQDGRCKGADGSQDGSEQRAQQAAQRRP